MVVDSYLWMREGHAPFPSRVISESGGEGGTNKNKTNEQGKQKQTHRYKNMLTVAGGEEGQETG